MQPLTKGQQLQSILGAAEITPVELAETYSEMFPSQPLTETDIQAVFDGKLDEHPNDDMECCFIRAINRINLLREWEQIRIDNAINVHTGDSESPLRTALGL